MTPSRRICRKTSSPAWVPIIRLKPFRGFLSPFEPSKEDRMSDVIDRPILEQEAAAKSRFQIIDCDIHPSLNSRADLSAFLPKRWQEHLKTYGDKIGRASCRERG